MVDTSYLLEQPPPPGPVKRRFDQVVIPAVVNAAYRGETVLQALAEATRRAPLTVLFAAFALGYAMCLRRWPR